MQVQYFGRPVLGASIHNTKRPVYIYISSRLRGLWGSRKVCWHNIFLFCNANDFLGVRGYLTLKSRWALDYLPNDLRSLRCLRPPERTFPHLISCCFLHSWWLRSQKTSPIFVFAWMSLFAKDISSITICNNKAFLFMNGSYNDMKTSSVLK